MNLIHKTLREERRREKKRAGKFGDQSEEQTSWQSTSKEGLLSVCLLDHLYGTNSLADLHLGCLCIHDKNNMWL